MVKSKKTLEEVILEIIDNDEGNVYGFLDLSNNSGNEPKIIVNKINEMIGRNVIERDGGKFVRVKED